jgi:hypothetical protein
MSALTNFAFRVLAVTGLALILVGGFLFLGMVLQATGAQAAPTTDSGVRLVVPAPEPAALPASLLKVSAP